MTPPPIITTYANAGLTYVIKAIVIVSYPAPVIFGDLVILKWAAGCGWRSMVGGGATKGLHSFLQGAGLGVRLSPVVKCGDLVDSNSVLAFGGYLSSWLPVSGNTGSAGGERVFSCFILAIPVTL